MSLFFKKPRPLIGSFLLQGLSNNNLDPLVSPRVFMISNVSLALAMKKFSRFVEADFVPHKLMLEKMNVLVKECNPKMNKAE